MTYTVRTSAGGMACQVTSTAAQRPLPAGHRLPHRPRSHRRAHPHAAGPAAGLRQGPQGVRAVRREHQRQRRRRPGERRRRHRATVDAATSALVSTDTNTVSSAPPATTACRWPRALRADQPFLATSSGYAGTAGDGLSQLDAPPAHRHDTSDAINGNVVQTAQLDARARQAGDPGARLRRERPRTPCARRARACERRSTQSYDALRRPAGATTTDQLHPGARQGFRTACSVGERAEGQ